MCNLPNGDCPVVFKMDVPEGLTIESGERPQIGQVVQMLSPTGAVEEAVVMQVDGRWAWVQKIVDLPSVLGDEASGKVVGESPYGELIHESACLIVGHTADR